MSSWTIVVAAGSGSRFGGSKQFADVNGHTVLAYSVAVARRSSDGVVLVVADPTDPRIKGLGADIVVKGGATRSESVRAGLAEVPSHADVIVVHDAARPLATKDLFGRVINSVRSGADAAIPGLPVVDTIKRVDSSGNVVVTVDRKDLVAVQTPQAFGARAIRSAHAESPEASDDAAVIEQAGGTVVIVPGEHNNIKITVPSDIDVVRLLAQA